MDKSGIKVAEYMTELPKRELLEQKLHKAVESARKRLEAQTCVVRVILLRQMNYARLKQREIKLYRFRIAFQPIRAICEICGLNTLKPESRNVRN